MYRKKSVPVDIPRVGLKRTTTTPVMRIGEGLVWEEGLAPETQPQGKNTLEGLIYKEPLGHILQMSKIPEEVR